MSLNDFITSDEVNGSSSWADDLEELPTAPAARDQFGAKSDGVKPFSDGRERPQIPLPTKPPFTAFLGNLNHDLVESEISDFFGGLSLSSIRIVKDINERPKGFGYAEFESVDDLKKAIEKNGLVLSGRTLRVTVAEPPKKPFGGSFEDEKLQGGWRRSGPLPSQTEEVNNDADENINWRATSRPTNVRDDKGFGFKGTSGSSDVDSKEWTRGGNVSRNANNNAGDDGGNWRATSRPSAQSQSVPSSSGGQRRKLQLAPRGSTNPQQVQEQLSTTNKSNPFGGAKPVDTASKEQSLLNQRSSRDQSNTILNSKPAKAQPEKKKVKAHNTSFSFAKAGLEVEGGNDDDE